MKAFEAKFIYLLCGFDSIFIMATQFEARVIETSGNRTSKCTIESEKLICRMPIVDSIVEKNVTFDVSIHQCDSTKYVAPKLF